MARVKRGVIARARHKKILKQAKGYYGARSRAYTALPSRRLSKLVSMLTVTAVNVSVSSVNCGLRVSTQQHVRTVFLTANSSTA
nr:50S ribosomal subunit protein L20 [Salmonella sp. NCTC 7297]